MTAPLTLVPHAASTNDLVREQPYTHWDPPFALATLDQRAGRGRQGRVWVNRPGDSLALTIVISPRLPREQWGWYPLLTALGAVDALTALLDPAGSTQNEPRISIKWPNDLLLPDGRKLAGILCSVYPGDARGPVHPGRARDAVHSAPTRPIPQGSDRLAIGIGINLRGSVDATDPLLARAATLAELLPSVGENASTTADGFGEQAARSVTDAVLHRVEQAESSTKSFHLLCEDYGENCVTVGRVVSVAHDGDQEALTGKAVGIDPLGQLIVRRPDHTEVTLSSGDVHLIPAPVPPAHQKGPAAR